MHKILWIFQLINIVYIAIIITLLLQFSSQQLPEFYVKTADPIYEHDNTGIIYCQKEFTYNSIRYVIHCMENQLLIQKIIFTNNEPNLQLQNTITQSQYTFYDISHIPNTLNFIVTFQYSGTQKYYIKILTWSGPGSNVGSFSSAEIKKNYDMINAQYIENTVTNKFILVTERFKNQIEVYNYSDFSLHNTLDCISDTYTQLQSDDFGCDNIHPVNYSGFFYLMIGLYTQPGVTHSAGDYKQGIIVKKCNNIDFSEISEHFWPLQSDTNLTTEKAQISGFNMYTSGSVQYLAITTRYYSYDDFPNTKPEVEITGPTDEVDVDNNLNFGADWSPNVNIQAIDMEDLEDNKAAGTWWIQDGDKWKEYEKTITYTTLCVPDYSKSTVTILKNAQSNYESNQPIQFSEKHSVTQAAELNINTVYIYNSYSYYLLFSGHEQSVIYEFFDIDMPYYLASSLPSDKKTIQEQYDDSDIEPILYQQSTFTGIIDYFNGYGTNGSGLTFSLQQTIDWFPATYSSGSFTFTGTPQDVNFIQVDEISILVTMNSTGKYYKYEKFRVEVFNVPPTVNTPLQQQFEDSVGVFITDTKTYFVTEIGSFSDYENKDLTISIDRIAQIDTTSLFREEKELSNFPTWLTFQVNPDTYQITVIGIAPTSMSKYEFRIFVSINDGNDATTDSFIIKIQSFKNPFLGMQLKATSSSQNEKAEKVYYMEAQNGIHYICVFIQNYGLQFNEIINPRTLRVVNEFSYDQTVIDILFLQVSDGEHYIVLTKGGSEIEVLDISDPQQVSQRAVVNTFDTIEKLKIVEYQDTNYLQIIDSVNGIYLANIDVSEASFITINQQNPTYNYHIDFFPISVLDVTEELFIGIYDNKIEILKSQTPGDFTNLQKLLVLQREFYFKSFQKFADDKRSYLALASYEHGLQIVKIDSNLMDYITDIQNNSCDMIFDFSDSNNNTSIPACQTIKQKLILYYVSYFDAKNMYDLLMYQDNESNMVIVSDGYLGVKMISLNFVQAPKLVTYQETFDAQSSIIFEYDNEIYLGLADERQGCKMIQLIQGSSDKPFYSYASVIETVTESNSQTIENALNIKIGYIDINKYAVILDGDFSITIIQIEDPENPSIQKKETFGQAIHSFDISKFDNETFLFVLFQSQQLKVYKIRKSDLAIIEQNLQVEGSNSTIQNIYSMSNLTFDLNTQLCIVSDNTLLKIYQFHVISSSTVNFVLINTQSQANINKIVIQIIQNSQTLLLSDSAEQKIHLYTLETPNNPQKQSEIDIEEGMKDAIYYEQEIDKQNDIKNQILVVADGLQGVKFFDAADLSNIVFLHKINTYYVQCVKILDFNSSGLFLAYTDDVKGIRILYLNLDINTSIPQQRVVYYTDEGPSNYMETLFLRGRLYGLLADGFSGYRVLELSSEIGLYPKLSQIIDESQKLFQIKLFPVFKNTLSAYVENIKLIKLSITEASRKILQKMPYWTTININQRVINLSPPQKLSLSQVKYIYYKFSTVVQKDKLKDMLGGTDQQINDLFDLLQKFGYIIRQEDYFLSPIYDPLEEMVLPYDFYQPNLVFQALKQFMYEGFFEVDEQFYIELNSPPELINTRDNVLQQQYKEQVGNPIKVNKTFYYKFSEIFLDIDNDKLEYDVSEVKEFPSLARYEEYLDSQNDRRRNLVTDDFSDVVIHNNMSSLSWVEFDPEERTFRGTIISECLDKVYLFIIESSDGYDQSYSSFYMDMTDDGPYLSDDTDLRLQFQYYKYNLGQQPHPTKKTIFGIDLDVFQDIEDDELTYEVMVQKNKPEFYDELMTKYLDEEFDDIRNDSNYWTNFIILDGTQDLWLKYNSYITQFHGIPDIDEIGFYLITITARDINKEISDSFVLDVRNESPQLNDIPQYRLQAQYDSAMLLTRSPHPLQHFQLIIELKQFFDVEFDELTFTVFYQKSVSQYDNLMLEMFNQGQYENLKNDSDFWRTAPVVLDEFADLWLKYNSNFNQFKGTPEIEDLGLVLITIRAQDMTDYVEDYFILTITNEGPNLSIDQTLTLQSQYEKLITLRHPHPFQDFFMSISTELFEDFEGDELTYTVIVQKCKEEFFDQCTDMYLEKSYEQLKINDNLWDSVIEELDDESDYWLRYSPQFQFLQGTPEVEDLGIIKITMTVEDISLSISDTFVLGIYNDSPRLENYDNINLQQQYDFFLEFYGKPHPYQDFSMLLQTNLFQDLENDPMEFIIQVIESKDGELQNIRDMIEQQRYQEIIDNTDFWKETTHILSQNIQYWLEYDPIRTEFTAYPELDQIGAYYIKITARDMSKEVSDFFILTVTNDRPYLSDIPKLQLQNQFQKAVDLQGEPHPFQDFKLKINKELFLDIENDQLVYDVNVLQMKEEFKDQAKEMYSSQQYNEIKENAEFWEINQVQLDENSGFWLRFDPEITLFQGTPGIEDIGFLLITFTARDFQKSISSSFVFVISNYGPYLSSNSAIAMQAQYLQLGYHPHPETEFRFQMNKELFKDEENDFLTYTVEIQSQLDDEETEETLQELRKLEDGWQQMASKSQLWESVPIPLTPEVSYWIKFDPAFFELYGYPEIEDYKYFRLNVTASDMTHSVSDIFVMKVSNHRPQLNKQAENEVPKARKDSKFEFTFDIETFIDLDKDQLNITAPLLPPEYTFNPEMRKIEGIPLEKGVQIVRIKATDLVGEFAIYEFEIDVRISLLQLIMIIVGLITPFASLLTILKHQQLIYSILCKRQYQYLRYDLAPVCQKFVKQIPLIRLELIESETIWKGLKKNSIQQLKLKHGKKNKKIWKNWIYQLYFDQEEGEFNCNAILKEMLTVSKQKQLHKISAAIEKNFTPNSHYYVIIKAQLARELLKQSSYGYKVYKKIKSDLKKIPFYHYSDKGRKIKTIKCQKDWYKCLISKVEYSYTTQEENMFPNYEIDDELVQTLIENAQQHIDTNIRNILKLKPGKSDPIHQNLQYLVKENFLAEIQGILLQNLWPFVGESHGNSMIVRTQNIKSLQAMMRIDTYNSGNRFLSKLGFFKLDYVPLAGNVNEILPEWLDFTINNGVLEFQGVPPVDYLGRHLMIQIISNKDFIIREFFIKFSDSLDIENKVKSKKKEFLIEKGYASSRNMELNTQHQKLYNFSQNYQNKLYLAAPSQKSSENTSVHELESIQSYNSNGISSRLMLRSDTNVDSPNEKKLTEINIASHPTPPDIQTRNKKLSVMQEEKMNAKLDLLNLVKETLEKVNQSKVKQEQNIEDSIKELEEKNHELQHIKFGDLYNYIELILLGQENTLEMTQCLKIFLTLYFNSLNILHKETFEELKEDLSKIEPNQDFSVESRVSSINPEIIQYIDKVKENWAWFGKHEENDEQLKVYCKWIKLFLNQAQLLELRKQQTEILSSKFNLHQEEKYMKQQVELQSFKFQTFQQKRQEIRQRKSKFFSRQVSINSQINMSMTLVEEEYQTFQQHDQDLDIRLQYSQDMFYRLLVFAIYTDEVIQQNNGEIHVNGLVISDKINQFKEQIQLFLEKYTESTDFEKYFENLLIDKDNLLRMLNFHCNKPYPNIQYQWNVLLFIASNVLNKQIILTFDNHKEYEDMHYQPLLNQNQRHNQFQEKDTVHIIFHGQIEKGHFYISIKDFFEEGNQLNINQFGNLNNDKLFKDFTEVLVEEDDLL